MNSAEAIALAAACVIVCAACVRQPLMSIESAADSCGQVVSQSLPHATWIGPTAPRDRARLDRWCSGVGPMVADAEPRVAPAPADTLAIVVWNVHGH